MRDLGEVIEDKESFRHAGSKVFTKAQYRMEMIARTEVLRAHNQGRIKFHQQVGVQKLEWLAMEDERMCPVCGGLDGKVVRHRPVSPTSRRIPTAGARVSSPGRWSSAAANSARLPLPAQSACILPPQAIEEQAKQKAEEEKKLKSAFESGEIADLSALTVKQLQTLAKQNGIAVARTKADSSSCSTRQSRASATPISPARRSQAKVKQYNIAALRSKDDLAKLLAEKQAAIKQAKALEEAAKAAAPQAGLSGLTMVQLKDMAKQQGISLNLTKPEVIEMLDALEPRRRPLGLLRQGPDRRQAEARHSAAQEQGAARQGAGESRRAADG